MGTQLGTRLGFSVGRPRAVAFDEVGALDAVFHQFFEIAVFTTPGVVAAEGGESSEDSGAQCEWENTLISLSGPQEVEKAVEQNHRKIK